MQESWAPSLAFSLAFYWLHMQKPKSLEVCTLLSKKIPKKVPIKVKYVGFEIEDRFVVGYGLDYAEKYREIPYIAYIN